MHDDVSRNGDNRLEKSRDLLKKRDWIQPLSLIAVPLYLYLNLFTFTNVPFLLGGDQTFFWIPFGPSVRIYGGRTLRCFFLASPSAGFASYLRSGSWSEIWHFSPAYSFSSSSTGIVWMQPITGSASWQGCGP